ncbi:MAG: BCCT family transporter [Gammaproteobacteria bacterium]|nr:BCCT family transporter [Gammaproteobacteria bacterium]
MSTPVKTAPILFFPRCSRPVFISAALVIFGFIFYGTVFTAEAEQLFQFLQNRIIHYFGWYYVVTVTFLLGFVIWLLFSRYGAIRLGMPEERPAFTTMGWFSMLFSAGMGIGLLFWSIAEPVNHYMNPPHGEGGGTLAAADNAIQYTFFHWGLHAWAIYVVVALCLAYFGFRRKLPLSIRSAFYPLIGERIYGPIGHVIDILAVFGTMFGIATSLGLGAIQVNAGLNYLLGVETSAVIQIVLIALMTALATTSVILGLHRGIKRLSILNIVLSAILVGFILIVGPTLFVLNLLVESTGRYLQQIVYMSFWTDVIRDTGWTGNWTVFYWGWWIAWSPFVGMFIARVSRGRTIREFILGVLFAPTLATFVWVAILGGTAIDLELNTGGITGAVSQSVEQALYVTLDKLPWAALTSIVSTIVIITYFVTSADSGGLVIDMLCAGGDPNPPKIQRVFWSVLIGVVASVLLLAGGLKALQTASITSALPFSVIILLMVWSLIKALRTEPIAPSPTEEPPAPETMSEHEEQDYESY